MVTWAQDENLKMWHNYKLINKMNNFIEFKVGIFSEDDFYFYIGYSNIIERLNVLLNFRLLDGYQLDIKTTEGFYDIDDFVPF